MNTTITSAVNNRVRQILNSRGMSAYRLGKDSTISQNTIKTLMRGSNASVNLKTVLQICRGLGITASEFFDDPIFESDELDID